MSTKGEHFERYFTSHGYHFEPNDRGEATVLCPFQHVKGFESNPSAHININKGTFHCKTCAAEGRFAKGGMSEVQFVAMVNKITYAQALRYMNQFEERELASENWEEAMSNLQANQVYLDFLHQRGLTSETIRTYKLGTTGDGIIYPVFIEDFLLDKRTYNPQFKEEGTAKIRSTKHGSVLLFPFDAWKKDQGPTLFCAGENDTLLARQLGFNSITLTGGEGASIPKVFVTRFKDKQVYVCYDCDSPGRIGAKRIAFQLKEAGAHVKIVDLGLTGQPDDKDLSDFILKHNHTAEDLYQKLEESKDYDENEFQEAKDEEYPLVDLWQIAHAQYHNKYVSSRVLMQGEFGDGSLVMQAPSCVEWECPGGTFDDAGKSACWGCEKVNKSGMWFLEDYNIGKVLELVEVTKKDQDRYLNEAIGLPSRCPNAAIRVKDWQHVRKVVFTPDVETEGEWTDFREAEVYAYTIGLDLKDGQRYRVYYRSFAHPLDDQRTVMVVDRAEDSDNSINTFRMTPEIRQELEDLFCGDPFVKMEERYEHVRQVVGKFSQRNVALATDLVYHSVLDYKFNGREDKGHPEVLIIGPPRQGKSKTVKLMQRFYGIGNAIDLKQASEAGLIGGSDGNGKGQYRTKWGVLPKNHKGFLFMDELSGLREGIINKLTAIRSERVANIVKISGSGKAPAKVRLIWASNAKPQKMGNHKETKSMMQYPSGVDVVKELIGAEEDISRFDLIILLPDMEIKDWVSPLEDEMYELKDRTPYRNLIFWAWSRTADQVKFDQGVEEYIVQLTREVLEKYFPSSGLFTTETNLTLTRFAISVATCCFSHDGTGENVLVKKEHVDWAHQFIIGCYDNEVFKLRRHVEGEKQFRETNPQINLKVAQLCKTHEPLMQCLAGMQSYSMFELKNLSGMDQEQFGSVLSDLMRHSLIRANSGSITPTMRLAKALEFYRDEYDKYRMIPLSEQGGSRI